MTILVLAPPFTVAFLLDIIKEIKDCKNDFDEVEVELKEIAGNREYFILWDGRSITVSSRNRSVELPKWKRYTVQVKNGRCSENTSFSIPKGRCTRVSVVSFLFF